MNPRHVQFYSCIFNWLDQPGSQQNIEEWSQWQGSFATIWRCRMWCTCKYRPSMCGRWRWQWLETAERLIYVPEGHCWFGNGTSWQNFANCRQDKQSAMELSLPVMWETRGWKLWDAALKKMEQTRCMVRGSQDVPEAQISTTSWLSHSKISFSQTTSDPKSNMQEHWGIVLSTGWSSPVGEARYQQSSDRHSKYHNRECQTHLQGSKCYLSTCWFQVILGSDR